VRDSLGLNRSAPDEFRVVSHPPLTIPPDFYLVPPDEARARAARTRDETLSARDILSSRPQRSVASHYKKQHDSRTPADTATPAVQRSNLPSSAEQVLLRKVGANQADPDIRTKLREEEDTKREQEQTQQGWFDQWLDMPLTAPAESEPVVDAAKERQRLITNQQEGKAPNEGDVPTVTEQRTILDEWF
jgi:hypothetical protein